MVRKIFFAAVCVVLCTACTLSAYAEENTGAEMEYYDVYDDYYEFEQDYLDSIADEARPTPKKLPVSPAAMAVGGAAGLIITFALMRNSLTVPKAEPYFRKAKEKHRLVNKTDEKSVKINEVKQ